MALAETAVLMRGFACTTRVAMSVYPMARAHAAAVSGLAVAALYAGRREGVYNILWAVVFGFATLNILSLAARRFEPNRRGLTFGEMMAVMVVMVSIFLLGWEMLSLFRVFPIRLRR